jgi:two-component system, chemotaxis family, sensor kinase CheA
VPGLRSTVIKPLGGLFEESPAVSGSTVLGDGTVALILHVPTLLAEAVNDDRVASQPGWSR